MTNWKSGSELKVGDVIEIGGDRYDRITSLRPYVGRLDPGDLSGLWKGKARIAAFEVRALGQTIEPQMRYKVKGE